MIYNIFLYATIHDENFKVSSIVIILSLSFFNMILTIILIKFIISRISLTACNNQYISYMKNFTSWKVCSMQITSFENTRIHLRISERPRKIKAQKSLLHAISRREQDCVMQFTLTHLRTHVYANIIQAYIRYP